MRKIEWSSLDDRQKGLALERPAQKLSETISSVVSGILDEVRERGDAALFEMSDKYDAFTPDVLRVSEDSLRDANADISADGREAIALARESITKFHEQQPLPDLVVETAPGVRCSLVTRPIESVGLYVPGGTAPLVSTVLMLAIPARIADCPRIVLCSPPPIAPEIIYAANLCGVEEVYQVGGAQAIGALAYGTASIPRVDKIFGPGNSYVTEAKRQVALDPRGAGIDMIAGPTELMVVIDETANPRFVAADLLSQLEHGADSQVILVSTCQKAGDLVENELQEQLRDLPRRDIAIQAMQTSVIVTVDSVEDAVDVVNQYAPEHLSLQTVEAASLVDRIQNAGSIFVGSWSPESAGDYASGTNHVLPTYGSAVHTSGISVRDFQKTISVQELSPDGLQGIGRAVEILARLELLEGHARAVGVRLETLPESASSGQVWEATSGDEG